LSVSAISEKMRLLQIVHHVSQSLYHLSLGRWIWGPWIEVASEKPFTQEGA
jgi:hypothetical protein